MQEKIKVFRSIVADLSSNYLKTTSGFYPDTARIIFDELIAEIEENRLLNKQNIVYFRSRLSALTRNDAFFSKKNRTKIILAIDNISSDRAGYLLAICKDLMSSFEDGDYIKYHLGELRSILESNEPVSDKICLKLESEGKSILGELLFIGNNLKEASTLLDDIFDTYRIQGEYVHTKFPNIFHLHSIGSREIYNRELISYISGLSIADRLNYLAELFTSKGKEYYFLFAINGLKGIRTFHMGDVVFFVPGQVSENDENVPHELLRKDLQNDQEIKFAQAAVKFRSVLPKSVIDFAIRKIDNVLDVLSIRYAITVPLRVDKSNWMILDLEGNTIYGNYSVPSEDRVTLHRHSLDWTHFGSTENIDFHAENDFTLVRRSKNHNLNNAIHWHRKGCEAVKESDRLIYFWISIESLFNIENKYLKEVGGEDSGKIAFIKKIIVATQFNWISHDIVWDIYYRYSRMVYHQGSDSLLSEELISKAKLRLGAFESVSLDEVVARLDDFIAIETNHYFRSKIEKVSSIISDVRLYRSHIEDINNRLKNDFAMIYRLRNLIVHNATFTSMALPYYAWMAKMFSGTLIRSILEEFEKGRSLEEALSAFLVFKDWHGRELKNGISHFI